MMPMPAPSMPHPMARTDNLNMCMQMQVSDPNLNNMNYYCPMYFPPYYGYPMMPMSPSLQHQQSFASYPSSVGTFRASQLQCFNCDAIGHVSRECPNPRMCFICGRKDHMARQCTLLKAQDDQLLEADVAVNPATDADFEPEESKQGQEHSALHITDCQIEDEGPDFCAKTSNPTSEMTVSCQNCGKAGHRLRSCTERKKCFLCSLGNHIAKDCPLAVAVRVRGKVNSNMSATSSVTSIHADADSHCSASSTTNINDLMINFQQMNMHGPQQMMPVNINMMAPHHFQQFGYLTHY